MKMTTIKEILSDTSVPSLVSESTTETNRNSTTNPLSIIWEIIIFYVLSTWYIIEAIYRLFVPVTEKSVKGEIVLITGTGHGIGRQLAFQYASQGAIVVCWDINEKTNQDTVKIIQEFGHTKAYAYVCDVSKRENVMEVARKVQAEVGDVTILINNAGIMPSHPFLDHTTEEIESIININVMAHFWTLQAFLPKMIEKNHGHIVSLSSCAGLIGLRNLVAYCASKHAVRGMMDALNRDLRVNPKNRIKITIIYPYMVDTGLCIRPQIRFPSLMPMQKEEEVAQQIISAQRRDVFEVSIPRHYLSFFYYLKLHPDKIGNLMNDILQSYTDSDL
ncbi:hypothetical protein ILUMI_23071 [Ignelater luminosus]|uniref:Short-chain dehydrogenase/reductase 3 n=1 Tax=Ignelater luminosus TaxID=2038154 RepID=A0A8K0CBK3_IGNLU|nr:hypothetical protein ILUMI_23071 [Ignelater luminosus]